MSSTIIKGYITPSSSTLDVIDGISQSGTASGNTLELQGIENENFSSVEILDNSEESPSNTKEKSPSDSKSTRNEDNRQNISITILPKWFDRILDGIFSSTLPGSSENCTENKKTVSDTSDKEPNSVNNDTLSTHLSMQSSEDEAKQSTSDSISPVARSEHENLEYNEIKTGENISTTTSVKPRKEELSAYSNYSNRYPLNLPEIKMFPEWVDKTLDRLLSSTLPKTDVEMGPGVNNFSPVCSFCPCSNCFYQVYS